MIDLEPIKKLIAEATPGPWSQEECIIFCPEQNGPDEYRAGSPMAYKCDSYTNGMGLCPEGAEKDASFISESRTLIPQMVQEIEKLREQEKQLRETISKLPNLCEHCEEP